MPAPLRPWETMGRPKQLPPDHPRHPLPDGNPDCIYSADGYYCRWIDREGKEHRCEGQDNWLIWLLLTGRGFGKTYVGANWILSQALKYPNTRWAVVAPAYSQVEKVCFKGKSGILAQALKGEIESFNKNELVITLCNGSEIFGFSADSPERIRGHNLSGAWMDEIGSFPNEDIWDDVIVHALREDEPRVVVTTTPHASPLLKKFYDRFFKEMKLNGKSRTHLTTGASYENTYLSGELVQEAWKELEGTRSGRREVEGEMLGDFEGALWKREYIDDNRIDPEDFNIDKMIRVVVAVDPSMTAGEKADESGIIVAGVDANKHGYCIADLSRKGSPNEVMSAAASAFHAFGADCVIMEMNQGGDYLLEALRAVDPGIPPRTVRAQKGKLQRAEPVSILAEKGMIHHVGVFPVLEDQLCRLRPDVRYENDDHADAFVWAFRDLREMTAGSYMDAYGYAKCSSCAHTYNKAHGRCPRCGKKEFESKPLPPGEWARAYKNTCPKCKTVFPQREAQCPQCNQNPMGYLAKVTSLSQNQTGWVNYQPKNWFR